ncbi:MAG: porin family protein [Tannerella sp.]|jgi:opacity protein-like surface antigen|nr:porin family protein [Tannerella sp.]
MKKLLLVLVCISVFVSYSFSQTKYIGEKGVSSVGVIAGYAVDNNAFAMGLDFRYNILDYLRLAPSVLYALEHDSRSTWYANVDAHYLLRTTVKTTVYPIAGIGLSFWKLNNSIIPEINLKSELNDETAPNEGGEKISKVRIGLNLGAGVERRMTRDIILGAEFKYNLTTERAYNQAMILVRVAYYF